MKNLSCMSSKIFVLALGVFLIGACGFTPMYGGSTATNVSNQNNMVPQSELERISIDTIPDFEGQFLRNLLVDKFHRTGAHARALYALNVSAINARRTNLDITRTATATRAQMTLSTRITLTDNATAQDVFTRDITAVTSYNILGSEFATRVTEQNARENALKTLAQNIETQLALYFKAHSKP